MTFPVRAALALALLAAAPLVLADGAASQSSHGGYIPRGRMPIPQGAIPETGRRGVPDIDTTGSVSGRAPWNKPYEYDSGSDNDKFPERPYYQQGRGQQTGGPLRNLLPDDGIHIVPR